MELSGDDIRYSKTTIYQDFFIVTKLYDAHPWRKAEASGKTFTSRAIIFNHGETLYHLLKGKHELDSRMDVAKVTADLLKQFLNMRPAFRAMNARVGLLQHYFFKVTYKDKTTTYYDPTALQKFLQHQGSGAMET
ncbi:uncharacterized protein LOC144763959 isoform X3 [Lissotriton helveticus]